MLSLAFTNLALSVGTRNILTKNEMTMPAATLIANELKYLPTIPLIKAIGTKTQSSTSEIAKTLNAISFMPAKLAFRAFGSSFSLLAIFSVTTIASSMKIPMPSVSAIRLRRFMSYPMAFMMKNVATMLVGIATTEMMVIEKFLKNRYTITMVSKTPRIISKAV